MHTTDLILQLEGLVPQSVPVIRSLYERGVLDNRSRTTGISVAESLLQILTLPRANGLQPLDVFWSVLERLFNPYSNTQKISVPFTDGRTHATTCVSAARIFVLIFRQPAEYMHIVQGLTSPELSFTVVKTYEDPRLFQAKISWLQNRFLFRDLGSQTLLITICPDANALPRAILEHHHRWYPDYDFGQRGKKNSRNAVDVLLQSAMTNYALRGQYDSMADADRIDGVGGVPFGSFGYMALDSDILGRDTVYVAGPAAREDTWPFSGPLAKSPLDAPDTP